MKKPLPEIHNPDLLPFRFREIAGKVLLTNDAGEYVWLEPDQFGDLLAGTLSADSPARAALDRCNILRTEGAESRLMGRVRRRSEHLFHGPSLHILILTLRCNQACVYCHASRRPVSSTGCDMSRETAAKVLDVVFSSPARDLTIEFQGGEPTLNFDVLRFVVEEACRRNQVEGRNLYFSLVSNLGTLDDDQIAFLVDAGVMVCTSIDGPVELHDRNRKFPGHSAYREAIGTIGKFDRAYRERGLDPEIAYVNALATISRSSLAHPRELVDEYVRLGHKVIHLRPLNPFGMGLRVWGREGYTADEFLDFYRKALGYIIALNQQGTEMMEKMASIMLMRILTEQDPNYMDLRSPCGAGIGQMAYNHDGSVYTCDEGRMVGAMGDDLFCMGDVHRDSYQDIIRHPTLRSLCVASCLECLPGCADCAYAPYCGVCPVYNYVIEGDLVARCPANDRCRIQKGILDYLFERLLEPGMSDLLQRWTISKDRAAAYRRLIPLTSLSERG